MARVVVFTLFAILCLHTATAKCPAGAVQGPNERFCYKIHAARLSWIEAEGRCEAENGHLATVASCLINGFLHNVAADIGDTADYWVGGVCNARKADAWSWEDGSTWNYTNWATGHPAKGPVCLAFNASSGQWTSEDCNKSKSYLCQVPPIGHPGGVSAPLILPSPPPPLRCPYGWQYLEVTNLCYLILEHIHNAYSWNQAKNLCSDAGGGLVSIPNSAVNDALVTFALEAHLNEHPGAMVIGAFRDNSSRKWQWSDGSDMRYTHWDVENPTNLSVSECGFMKIPPPALGTWYNRACDQEDFAVICERESFDVGEGGALPPPNLPSAPTPARCPEGWQYLGATNLCYSVIEHRDSEYSWSEAKSQCSDAGAGLASVPNRAANDAIVTYAFDAGIHKQWVSLVIGASYNNYTDQWEWTDGSEMRYTKLARRRRVHRRFARMRLYEDHHPWHRHLDENGLRIAN